jgi:hypothetical protein
MVPLYEAKMIHHYDTRWATYEPDGETRYMTEAEKAEGVAPLPRYWVAEHHVDERLQGVRFESYFAWRGIARTTDARTAIGTVVPPYPGGGNFDMVLGLRPGELQRFAAAFSSFVFDFAVRQKLSNMHLQFSIAKQLPVPMPTGQIAAGAGDWVRTRVDRLNAWIASHDERAQVRAELDAYHFHLYGLTRDEADYVMETFPIVKRKDEAEHGTYRTKELILAAYDNLAALR